MQNRSDYDFDVISGPSGPPPARPLAFRPPAPPRPPAPAPAVAPRPAAGADEEA